MRRSVVDISPLQMLEKALPASVFILGAVVVSSADEKIAYLIYTAIFLAFNLTTSKLEKKVPLRFLDAYESLKTLFNIIYLGAVPVFAPDSTPFWILLLPPIFRSSMLFKSNARKIASIILLSISGSFPFLMKTPMAPIEALLPGGALFAIGFLLVAITNYLQNLVDDLKQSEHSLEQRVRERTIELKEAKNKYQDLYDNSNDMKLSISPETAEILECNRKLLTVLGCQSQDDVIGRSVFDFYHDDCMDEARRSFDQFVKTGEVKDVELILKKKDGSKMDVLLNVNAIRGEDGKIIRSRSSWLDITSQKKAREHERENTALRIAKEEAEKHNVELQKSLEEIRSLKVHMNESAKLAALGEMAGGVAHEINNPLAAIMMRASHIRAMLQRDPIDTARIDEFGQVIEKTGNKIKKIVEGLRFFARSGENDEIHSVVLLDIIEDTLVLCRERLSNHHIELRMNEIPPDVAIPCRAVQIGQILLNLLNNAIYIVKQVDPDKRWIEIKVENNPETIDIKIIDSGPGIPEAIRGKILQPFFTTKKIGEGTGLGLSISKGIAEMHQGDLYLDQQSQNTTFVLSLPKASPELEMQKTS